MIRILVVAHNFEKKDGWGTVAHHLAESLGRCGDAHVTRLALDEPGRLRGGRFSLLRSCVDYLRYRKVFAGQQLVVCVCEPQIPLCAFHRILHPSSRLFLLGMGTYIYFPFIRGPRKGIFRFLANRADGLFVISRFTQAKVSEWYKKTAPILPLGVESSLAETSVNSGVNSSKTFLFIGELKARKGVAPLMEAFAQVLKAHPAAILEFAGRFTAEHTARAARLGISGNVRFLGRVSDEELKTCFQRARAHVLPSVNTPDAFEGFGLVHLEANAFGIPSIGSAGTANEDVILDGQTGFLCRQGDVDHLASAMNRLLDDEQFYQKLCENSLRHAREKDWRKVLPQFWEKHLPRDKEVAI